MIVLVTGSDGLIGHSLVEELNNRDHQVVGVDRNHGVDVTSSQFLHSMPWQTIDAVVHLASPSSSVVFNRDRALCWRETVEPVRKLLEVFRGRLVIPSSGTVYGHTSTPACEHDWLPEPISSYAAAKIECERICFQHAVSGGNVKICRIFTGYGAREVHKIGYASPPHSFVYDVLRGAPVVVYGDGSQIRDFIHVDDVAKAIASVVETTSSAPVFNVGTGTAHSFNDLIDLIVTATGRRAHIDYTAAPEGYAKMSVADTALVKPELGWCPLISLDEGISRLVHSLNGAQMS